MRRVHIRGTLAAAALPALALAGCGSGTSDTGSAGSGGGGEITVTAHDFSFDTPSGSASPGASVTVKFINAGQTQHSFTLDNGGGEVVADGGATKTLTFTAPSSGSIAFHCKFHASMHGTLSTGGAAGSGASSSSTSGGGGYGGYTR